MDSGASNERNSANIDNQIVSSFGKEWSAFDQSKIHEELESRFQDYFQLLNWSLLPHRPKVLDVGCGSGRWARFVAPLVGELHLVDPSPDALEVARINLKEFDNCTYHLGHLDDGK